MTKDEIKKALECCSNLSIAFCKGCPYANNAKFSCADGKMFKDALNLITEQEKEIERLKAENERFESNMKVVLEIEKKQAKIDVLNELKERTYRDSVYYPEVKYEHKYVHMDDIDELIKEVQNEKKD
jgi:hypothetical protein